ncbi:MAG TPA: AI-2E family transporter [Pyrinomonadaceae bacterium]|nr:AI-2E family transporter [Pyrinomonadaceae bacterium]
MTKHRERVRHTEEHDEATADALALTEQRTRLVLRLASRSLLWVAVLVLVIYYLFEAVRWVFYALTGVLLVVVLAIFFAYLIAPLVELVRKGLATRDRKGEPRLLPRTAAIAVVYAAIFGSLGLGAWVITPRLGTQMAEITQQAPDYLTNARKRADRLNTVLKDLNIPQSVRDTANKTVSDAIGDVGRYITGEGFSSAINVLSYLPYLVLIPILAFFFLKDADSFRRSALMMLPQGRIRWRGDEFFQDINSTLAAYIRAQLISCLLIGSVCTAAFAIFGVRYALVLGVVAGMLEFIPLLGPVVVAVLAGTVAGFDSGTKALGVLLFLGVLRIVQDYVLYPRIIGSGIHLHPLAVILAILAGHELAGVAGIFLAIPVIAVMTVTYRHWLEHRGSSGIVAELLKPAETPTVETQAAVESLPDAPAPTPPAPTPDATRAEPAR